MSRITEMILEPSVTYTGNTVLVRVKVQDDYKYKKYIISENVKYTTATGESFTLTNIRGDQPGSILEITGQSIQNGTPTPDAPVEIQSVSGDNHINVNGKNNFDGIFELGTINASGQNSTSSSIIRTKNYTDIKPNAPYTLKNPSQVTGIALYYYKDNTYVGTSSPGLKQDKSVTFTTRADANQVRWRYNTGYTTTENEVMLLEGTIAMADIPEYEAYVGNKYGIDLGLKNQLNFSNEFYSQATAGGLSYKFDGDTMIINGTSTGYNGFYSKDGYSSTRELFKMKANRTYRWLIKVENNTNNVIMRFYAGQTSSNIINCQNITNGIFYKDYTPTADVTFTQLSIIGAEASGKIHNNTRVQFAIYDITKEQTTNYYPHSFNPIKLNGIGNYKNQIKRSTGKNLMIPRDFTQTLNGITCKYNSGNQTYTFNGTCTTDNTTFTLGNNAVLFETGITSATYWVGGSVTNYCQMRNYNSDYTRSLNYGIQSLSSSVPVRSATLNTEQTFEVPANRLSNIRFNSGSVATNFTIKVMVARTTNTEYEPSINVGKWYIDKKSKTIQVTPSMIVGFQNSKTLSKEARITKSTINCKEGSSADFLCSTFRKVANTWNNDQIGIMGNGGSSSEQISLRIPVDSDKTFFDTYPTFLLYQLQAPEYEEITNEELIEQLNEIQNMQMQNGETNIFWTGDIAPEMKLQYATNEELHNYIITEDGKRIRTDWRSIGRREKWTTK